MASGRQFTANRDSADPGFEGLTSLLSFRAESANRLLELPRRQVKVRFNLGGEVGVVLETEAVCDDLKGEAFGDKAPGEEHSVPSEQLLGSEARGSLNSVFQLPVGKLQMLRDSRNGKFLFLSKLEQVFAVRTPEVLPFARNSEFRGVLGHNSIAGILFEGPDL